MRYAFIIATLFATPAWGQSYDYVIQSQIADMQEEQQSQHEEMQRQQQEMRDEMAEARLEMAAQKSEMIDEQMNAQDYARYH